MKLNHEYPAKMTPIDLDEEMEKAFAILTKVKFMIETDEHLILKRGIEHYVLEKKNNVVYKMDVLPAK